MKRLVKTTSRGQAIVEFAVILLPFLMLVFGVVDGGRAILAYNQMSQNAREVARVATISCFLTQPRCDATVAPLSGAIATHQAGAQGPMVYTVTCIDPTTNAAAALCKVGYLVRVRVESQFDLTTPIIAAAMGHIDVSSTAQMTILQ